MTRKGKKKSTREKSHEVNKNVNVKFQIEMLLHCLEPGEL